MFVNNYPKYILTVDNNNLVISLAEMKDYLKLDSSADDTLIIDLIKSATRIIEGYTKRELLTKTFNLYIDFFPCGNIPIHRSKLQSVDSIQYYYNNVLETLDSSLYSFTQSNDFSDIFLISYSSFYPSIDCRKQAIIIEFQAGYGVDDSYVPIDIKNSLKRIVAMLYSSRGDCEVSEVIKKSQSNIILDQYVIYSL